VARKCKRREAGLVHRYCELLAQFAYQGVFRPLALLDLAAGKFPEAGHGFALRSFRDQHTAVRIDERAGSDKSQFDAHNPRPRGVPVKHSSMQSKWVAQQGVSSTSCEKVIDASCGCSLSSVDFGRGDND
jgi:hypothetical protein